MHIPCILPDEYILGYIGRIRILNNFQGSQETTRALLKRYQLANEGKGIFCKFTAIASAIGISEESLVQQHTLAHFTHAFSVNNAATRDKPYVGKFQITTPDKSILQIPRDAAKFCPDCVSQDLTSLGFPYWRRFHQVVGIEWCPKHKTPLFSVNISTAYDFHPESEIISRGAITMATDKEYLNYPALRRYADIAHGLIKLTKPFHAQRSRKTLSFQALKLGIHIYKCGKGPYMSDMALENFPKDWLLRNFPLFSNKERSEPLGTIDLTCRPGISLRVPARNYVLAASLLYDDPNSALHALTNPPNEKDAFRISALIKTSDREKQIESAYIKSNGNHWKTSKILGAELRNLKKVLNSHGLPNLKEVSSEMRQSLVEFLSGTPISQISISDKEQFFNLLRTAGSPLFRTMVLMDKDLPFSNNH